jgi:hypothetical protein
MNLEDLKSVWKEPETQSESFEEERLRTLLRKRSRSAISRINRSIWIEAGLVLLILLVFLVSLFPYETFLVRFQTAWVVVLSVASLVYYWYKFRILNRKGMEALPLHDYLREMVRRMQRFMRIYDFIIVILMPLFLISGFIAGFVTGVKDAGSSLQSVSIGGWAMVIALLAGMSAVVIGMGKGYIWLMYGRYFSDLKKCLAELESGNGFWDMSEAE